MNRTKLIKVAVASLSLIGSGGVLLAHWVERDRQTLKAFQETQAVPMKFEPTTKWDFNWDKRVPSALIKPKSKSASITQHMSEKSTGSKDDSELLNKHSSRATRHLFLIRHGNYEIKEKESEKKVLTQLGKEQAEYTGNYLKELAQGRFKYSKLHYSTLIRAVQTAEIIKSHLSTEVTAHVDPILCEGSPIPPEPPIGHWRPEFHHFQDGPRIEAAFRKYFHRAPPEQLEDSYEVIVCHANVIRYFFCRALQFPAEAWLRFDLYHGSITHFIIRPDGRVFCRNLGECGFQPPSKLTTS